MRLYGLVGAGGFGREVMPVAADMLQADLADHTDFELVFVDENLEQPSLNGCRVLKMDAFLASEGLKFFNVAIANHQIRKRIAEQLITAKITPFEIRARNSICLKNNNIRVGGIFCPFTTVTANAEIGRFFHCNIYSYVAHDCRIGDFVTFAPNVHCNGGVIVEDGAYIGTGAVIRQGTTARPLVIGRDAVVGMGAVVTKSVSAGTTVVGNPAAPLKPKKS